MTQSGLYASRKSGQLAVRFRPKPASRFAEGKRQTLTAYAASPTMLGIALYSGALVALPQAPLNPHERFAPFTNEFNSIKGLAVFRELRRQGKLIVPVSITLLCFSGCVINHQEAIASKTLSGPDQTNFHGDSEEFIAKVSKALTMRFPAGTPQGQLIDYARSLGGECDIAVDRKIFAPRDLEIGNVICTVPERNSLFLRSEIVLNDRVESRKIVWLNCGCGALDPGRTTPGARLASGRLRRASFGQLLPVVITLKWTLECP
ncbi:hypothetical protein [Paraburkholderia sp. J10-1]|uniref:hypothetical protein n=1 Tax=Paraburkholderia sp. J10-1 TaxID=2805430 RepID=UPI002AB7B726|nr:hypothetical protein [Paraburkholderia sp. J10-1]